MIQVIEELKEKLDIALERVRQLEQELGRRAVAVPLVFKFTFKQEQIFRVLLSRPIVSKEGLMLILYGDRFVGEKILDVFICKIRRKIASFGLTIVTVYGRGYYISTEDKEKVREMLKAERGTLVDMVA